MRKFKSVAFSDTEIERAIEDGVMAIMPAEVPEICDRKVRCFPKSPYDVAFPPGRMTVAVGAVTSHQMSYHKGGRCTCFDPGVMEPAGRRDFLTRAKGEARDNSSR